MTPRKPGPPPRTPRWASSTDPTENSFVHTAHIGTVDLLSNGDDQLVVRAVRVMHPVEGEDRTTTYAPGPFAVEIRRTTTSSAPGLIGARAAAELASLITDAVALIERLGGGKR